MVRSGRGYRGTCAGDSKAAVRALASSVSPACSAGWNGPGGALRKPRENRAETVRTPLPHHGAAPRHRILRAPPPGSRRAAGQVGLPHPELRRGPRAHPGQQPQARPPSRRTREQPARAARAPEAAAAGRGPGKGQRRWGRNGGLELERGLIRRSGGWGRGGAGDGGGGWGEGRGPWSRRGAHPQGRREGLSTGLQGPWPWSVVAT